MSEVNVKADSAPSSHTDSAQGSTLSSAPSSVTSSSLSSASSMTPSSVPSSIPSDPQELAQASAAAMYERDHAAHSLAIKIDKVAAGTAELSMKVRKDMVNGHDICHGGMIFCLADTAFAYSCNSYNRVTVASGCTIEFVRPGMLGDVLTARAVERSLSRRTGVYDVEVTNQDGKTIALFRGKSARLEGEVIGS